MCSLADKTLLYDGAYSTCVLRMTVLHLTVLFPSFMQHLSLSTFIRLLPMCFLPSGATMAEAHSAVAFSFSVSHEGVDLNYDHEMLGVVLMSGVRSWNRRIHRFFVSTA